MRPWAWPDAHLIRVVGRSLPAPPVSSTRPAARFATFNSLPVTSQYRPRSAISTVIAMRSGGWYRSSSTNSRQSSDSLASVPCFGSRIRCRQSGPRDTVGYAGLRSRWVIDVFGRFSKGATARRNPSRGHAAQHTEAFRLADLELQLPRYLGPGRPQFYPPARQCVLGRNSRGP